MEEKPLRVRYYFRAGRPGVYSIEVLFDRIVKALGDSVRSDRVFVPLSHAFSLWMKKTLHGTVHHITGDVNFAALFLNGRKTVLTIHDIGHYSRTLKGWRKALYRKVWLEWPLRKVAAITAVSEFSRSELLAAFDISPSKVKVVYNPYPPHYQASPKENLSDIPRILQIGGGAHKNLQRLIQAVTGFPFHLILVRPPDVQIRRQLETAGISFSWHYQLSAEEMQELYVNCDIVFFASLYEGFGMPILEAQAVGRPVITSNCASMPEVGGDGVHLVDPFDPMAIRNALLQLVQDKQYRCSLVARGFQNLPRFSPQEIARNYLQIYRELSTGNR